MTELGVWLSALGTLAVYSFLYRDNPVYRATEQILVGLSVGYLVVVTVKSTLVPKVVTPLADGNLWGIVAALWVLLMWTRLVPRQGWLARLPLVPAGLLLCVVVAPAVMTFDSHPWGLSAYTSLVGGAPGAANLGLNRTFWGYTTGAVQGFVNEQVPKRGAVYVHDTAMQSFDLMRRDRRLRPDLRGVWRIHDSSYALYHHEPHMSRVEHQVWVDYGTTAPAHVGTHHGVPVVWIFARPESTQPGRSRLRAPSFTRR